MMRTHELREGAMYKNDINERWYKILSVKPFPRNLIEISYRDPFGGVFTTTYDRDTEWSFGLPDFFIEESDELVVVEN
jgi:hypothetical protein